MTFSPKIQSLIDSSGQDIAASRAAQLSAFVERIQGITKGSYVIGIFLISYP